MAIVEVVDRYRYIGLWEAIAICSAVVGQTGMYGPPLCRKRKMKLTRWSAQMYSAFVGAQAPGLDGMRCALVLFSYAALEGFSGLQVSRAPGSTVVSSHSSPADLAGEGS